MTRTRIILLAIVGTLLLAGAVYAFIELTDEEVKPANDVSSEQQDEPQDNMETDDSDKVTNETSEDMDQPKKEPVSEPKQDSQPATVESQPLVYTGYGHTSERPLRQGQQTSTTCTTDVNVMCKLVFTNQSSGEVIEFDAKKTNSQGVALWEWTGGEDVTSGKWAVVAKAGDKQSEEEIIYVE